jgi:hypothetical protein
VEATLAVGIVAVVSVAVVPAEEHADDETGVAHEITRAGEQFHAMRTAKLDGVPS